MLSGSRSDGCAKRQWEPIEEDGAEITVVKAQKLTKHEGHPCARDYDNVTQEFVITAEKLATMKHAMALGTQMVMVSAPQSQAL